MKPLHTAGPWTSREPLPEPFRVRDGNREWLTFDWHIHGAGGQLIGTVEFSTSNRACPRVNSMEEARANMRLVVAAPDLFSALYDCVLVMGRDLRGLPAIQAELAQARAALARARGAA